MSRSPPHPTLPYTPFPYTTLFRSANGEFTLNTADNQGVSGFAGGNPDLDEEVGKSYTVGLVWQPSSIDFLSKASFEFDYYNIKITDAIVQIDFQSVLNQCYSGDASFCDFITRRPQNRSEEHTSELQSLMRISYAVFCLKKQKL